MSDAAVAAVADEQKALQMMIDEMNKTDDPEDFQKILEMVQAQGAKLEETAKAAGAAIVQEHLANGVSEEDLAGTAAVPKVEVILTPEQRQKVYDETGVNMESVLIDDGIGVRTRTMPETTPPEIELQAIEQAHEFNRMVEAQKAIGDDVDDAMAGIEDTEDPQLIEALEAAKADPNFLTGLDK